MERLRTSKPSGMNRSALRAWGIVFLALGVIGRGLLQRELLGIGTISVDQLLQAMEASRTAMTYATMALVFQAMETCALPIFAFLLLEGFLHTSDFTRYLLRVTGAAMLSELPYNLAMDGKLFSLDTRNPAFGLVLSLIMLYFFRHYAGKSLKHIGIKLLVAAAAIVWTEMLRIEAGLCMVLVVSAMWFFRHKAVFRNLAGTTASILCSLTSPFYLAAPMSFLLVHFYNDERGTENRLLNYLAYPVVLLAVGVVAMLP